MLGSPWHSCWYLTSLVQTCIVAHRLLHPSRLLVSAWAAAFSAMLAFAALQLVYRLPCWLWVFLAEPGNQRLSGG